MRRIRSLWWTVLWLAVFLIGPVPQAGAQADNNLEACKEFAFSTEVDFYTRAGVPKDGNPIISDGDLLSNTGEVCLRNRELLAKWEIRPDLGLDAVDVIDVSSGLVAFSTELDDPKGRFGAGDLLTTHGAIIPNQALMRPFQVAHNVGLDGLHFIGKPESIVAFLKLATTIAPDEWLSSANLQTYLHRYDLDIWFSIEATERFASVMPIFDGDILSALHGIKVLDQSMIFPATVPGGLPNRGVDFGLDGVAGSRLPDRPSIRFSTEILYRKDKAMVFTDGDVLRALTGAVEIAHPNIVAAFEPYARFLGIDALHMVVRDVNPVGVPGGDELEPPAEEHIFLPLIASESGAQTASSR
jgi:hypothetical protein